MDTVRPHVVVLAAGKGDRMNIQGQKVLADIAGKPMIVRVLETVRSISQRITIVVGHCADQVMQVCGGCEFVVQTELNGTGGAVRVVRDSLHSFQTEEVLVCLGDFPLITENTLRRLIQIRRAESACVSMVTVRIPHFIGMPYWCYYDLGRVVRDQYGNVAAIVEMKDATEDELKITELNVSCYCFKASWLSSRIDGVQRTSHAGEFYLTDLIAIAIEEGERVPVVEVIDPYEGFGVNTQAHLACINEYLSRK